MSRRARHADLSRPTPDELGIETVRRSSGEDAAMYIRRLMFDGELRPGTRIPQDEIARALGISRIPVREALIALERDGWVTLEPHRGAFVNALDAQTVRDHYELYGIVYGFAARRAVERTPPAELADVLARVLEPLEGPTDSATLTRVAFDFHRTLVNAAGSARLKVVIRAMSGLVPGDFFSLVPGGVEDERRGLAAILAAVRSGDGDGAAREYLKMLVRVGEEVVEVLARRNLFDDDRATSAAAGSNGAARTRRTRRRTAF